MWVFEHSNIREIMSKSINLGYDNVGGQPQYLGFNFGVRQEKGQYTFQNQRNNNSYKNIQMAIYNNKFQKIAIYLKTNSRGRSRELMQLYSYNKTLSFVAAN